MALIMMTLLYMTMKNTVTSPHVKRMGLLVDKDHPLLGTSVDGCSDVVVKVTFSYASK